MIPRILLFGLLSLSCALPAQRRKGVKARQFYQLGIEAYEMGDFADAIIALSKSLKLETKNAPAFRLRGLSHIELNHPQEAMADLSASLRLDRRQADAWSSRGDLFFGDGKLKRALADYSEALKLDRLDALVWHNRAQVYQQLGDLDAALADFDSAIECDEKDPILLYNRGFCRREYGNHEGALEDLNAANAISKADPDLRVGRAELLIDAGDFAAAQIDLDLALQLRPKDFGAHAARARIHQAFGDLPAAVADWQIELAESPSQNVYYERAQALALLGRWKAAAQDFSAALSLGKSEELRLLEAVSHTAAGDYAVARRTLKGMKSGRARYWACFNDFREGHLESIPKVEGDPILAHLDGKLDRKGLLTAIGKDPFLRAEALFFVALKQGMDGATEAAMKTLKGIALGDGVLRVQRALVLDWLRRECPEGMNGDAGAVLEVEEKPLASAEDSAAEPAAATKTETKSITQYKIISLGKGGAAALAGLKLGDRLLLPTGELPGGRLSPKGRLFCRPGQILTVRVQRGASSHRTVLFCGLR